MSAVGNEGVSQPEPELDVLQARGSAEEQTQLAAAVLLSTNDTTANAAGEAEEGQAEPEPATPASIRKNDGPPPCLDKIELEGETGRKALIVEVQTTLRSSGDPSPDDIVALQEKFLLSPEEVMAVFSYFRGLTRTLSANIREHPP